jgi:hypothetical protein
MRNLFLILIFFVVTLITAAVVPFLYWAPKVLGCRTNSDRSTFLAYCNVGDFADYEHGALFWDLEPEAVKSLKAARVLFIGNSRTQHAFSTEATRRFFQARGIPYYLLGFGYGEDILFTQRLIEKYQLHPDAVVINSDDSFFSYDLKPIAAMMLGPKLELLYWKSLYNYSLKAVFSRIARPLCIHLPSLCTQNLASIWRNRETGEWDWQDTLLPKNFNSFAIQPSMRAPAPDEPAMQNIEKAAEKFFEALHLPSRCIILTAIPTSRVTDEPVADGVGKRFGFPVIVPHLDNLLTIDYDHLNEPSAERWSSVFLHDASPLLDRCMAEATSHKPAASGN